MRYLVLLFAYPLFATTSVSSTTPTNTQALIHVVTDQVGNCTYRISEDVSLTPLINDVNTSLFSGSNSDARTGSVISGTDHYFNAGTRTAAKATNGKFYSRALAANTVHYGGVTCGVDAEVTFTFTTSNILSGTVWADPLIFDSTGLFNYGIPTANYSTQSEAINDPQTGLKYRLLTGQGHAAVTSITLTGNLSTTGNSGNVNGVASGTNWTITGSNPIVYPLTYSTAAQDVLHIRMASTCGPGYGGGSCPSATSIEHASGYSTLSIDAYQLALTGDGGGSTLDVDVALTWNGVDQASEWVTMTLPASNGTVKNQSDYSSLLSTWQGSTYATVPGIIFNTSQQNYTVNTSGTAVTLSGSYPPCFSLDSRILKSGSKITINGTEYTISSVDSCSSLTLTGSAGTQSGVSAYVANFGFLLKKHSASAGTITISGISVGLALSETPSHGGSGFQQFCSYLTSTDGSGHTGRFCIFAAASGGAGSIWWVTDDTPLPDVRYIGRAFLPAGGSGGDAYNQVAYSGQSPFDSTDPNSWWIYTSLVSDGTPTLVKATYSGSYAAINPNWTTYDGSSVDNPAISYTQLTKPSLGLKLWTQFNTTITSGKFNIFDLSFVQNGKAIMSAKADGGDHESWIMSVSTTSGLVIGQYSTYMNAAEGSCRACVLHGTGPSDASDNYYYLIYNDYPGGGTTGAGPYQLTVTTTITTTPSNPTCFGVTDPAVTWLVPYSAGCDNITFSEADNIPCDPNPSAWELAHMPACVSHAGQTQWQAGSIQIGDWILGDNLNDGMVIGAHVAGSTWTVLRGVDVPHGPLMLQDPSNYFPTLHTANWTASLHCSFYSNAFVNTSEIDGSSLIWDRKFLGFNHSVLRTGGIVSAELGFQSVRYTPYPGGANTPETNRVYNTATFSGKLGLSGINYLQSHAGWNGNATSFLDFAPMAPAQGGNLGLWSQSGVTQVTASCGTSSNLYKIPNGSAYITPDKRRVAQVAWTGTYNIKDVSGLGTIPCNSGGNYQYCSIDYAGATCGQTGESIGDVYINIPSATNDGYAGRPDVNSINSIPVGQEPYAAMEYGYSTYGPGSLVNDGRHTRRLTTGLGKYNAQNSYSNSKNVPNSGWFTFNCGLPNQQRLEDICIGQALPTPVTEVGNDFISVPITFGSTPYAEVRFGYAENGTPSDYYCTSRQETCDTSSPSGTPFNWLSESRTLTSCGSGCMINVPGLPDHTIYYQKCTSADGSSWSCGAMMVAVVPRPSGPDCSDLAFVPTAHSSPATGDTGSITVTVTDPTCAWSATSDTAWLTITSGGSGTGGGTINWSTSANVGGIRVGHITSNSASFTDTQSSALPVATIQGGKLGGGKVQ